MQKIILTSLLLIIFKIGKAQTIIVLREQSKTDNKITMKLDTAEKWMPTDQEARNKIYRLASEIRNTTDTTTAFNILQENNFKLYNQPTIKNTEKVVITRYIFLRQSAMSPMVKKKITDPNYGKRN